MATCKHCGKPLILSGGKCIYCGAAHGEKVQVASMEPSKSGLPPVLTFTVYGVSFNMILVEGGSFYYGLDLDLLNHEIESGRDYKETFPLVNVDSFYIGETPVTQALWEAVMEEKDEKIAIWGDKKVIFNPSFFKGKELPVESIPSGAYHHFLERLNILTTANFRIPNNYEWEFAAKGGIKTKGYKYSGSDNLHEVAWYSDNSGKHIKRGLLSIIRGDLPREDSGKTTHPVKTKKPNELGIYDMSGNVAEFISAPYSSPLFRGGSWLSNNIDCSVVKAFGYGHYSCAEEGFRLALSPEEMAKYRQ